jgi:hypothetical protein
MKMETKYYGKHDMMTGKWIHESMYCTIEKNPRQNNHQHMRQGSFGIIHCYERNGEKN